MASHILLVDDDKSVLAAYSRSLAKTHTVTTIDCPQKALSLIKKEPIFDVIVSDIMMPIMDGLAFLSEVKEYIPSSSRIVLSGHMTTDLALRAINECMAFRYLTKPVAAGVLAKTIDQALETQKATRVPSSDFHFTPKDRALLVDFDKALADDLLELHYQPKIDMKTGYVSSAEALLRWDHPKYGKISPAHLIPLIEQSGRSDNLARWVIRKTCHQVAKWTFEDGVLIKVSLNLSPSNFYKDNFVDYVRNILEESCCPAELLEFEVTENLKVSTEESLRHDLQALKDMGITLSVDDFGAGYSSFDQLSKLPITQLKLDRSLMNDIPKSKKNRAIVTSLIGLSHSLGLSVVAEGVEKKEQADFLNEAGCDYGQGFLYSPAIEASRFMDWVQKHDFA
jgi:EAL domain-containing protein (putative c-di-GMP-specific phosphodiesterase class I)/CheY-like chemotaxis protein